jgi:prepilin-type N-terminal cleavage/methylation domain-containing protein
MKRAFTLVELLIVVAIIAILAAIAVPNFLEAQTRSKIARTQSDMRTMNTAVEAYKIDTNLYPVPAAVMLATKTVVDPMFTYMHDQYDHNFLSGSITTPIAYITYLPRDVFSDRGLPPAPEQSYIYYMNWEYTLRLAAKAGATLNDAQQFRSNAYGSWVMFSCGPDLDRKDVAPAKVGPKGVINGIYDPSNGTLSNGDIVRTQRNANGYSI